MSAREILFGHILNEKKGFTVESAAKTSFLLLRVQHAICAVLPPGFASGLRATEEEEETRECQS